MSDMKKAIINRFQNRIPWETQLLWSLTGQHTEMVTPSINVVFVMDVTVSGSPESGCRLYCILVPVSPKSTNYYIMGTAGYIPGAPITLSSVIDYYIRSNYAEQPIPQKVKQYIKNLADEPEANQALDLREGAMDPTPRKPYCGRSTMGYLQKIEILKSDYYNDIQEITELNFDMLYSQLITILFNMGYVCKKYPYPTDDVNYPGIPPYVAFQPLWWSERPENRFLFQDELWNYVKDKDFRPISKKIIQLWEAEQSIKDQQDLIEWIQFDPQITDLAYVEAKNQYSNQYSEQYSDESYSESMWPQSENFSTQYFANVGYFIPTGWTIDPIKSQQVSKMGNDNVLILKRQATGSWADEFSQIPVFGATVSNIATAGQLDLAIIDRQSRQAFGRTDDDGKKPLTVQKYWAINDWLNKQYPALSAGFVKDIYKKIHRTVLLIIFDPSQPFESSYMKDYLHSARMQEYLSGVRLDIERGEHY